MDEPVEKVTGTIELAHTASVFDKLFFILSAGFAIGVTVSSYVTSLAGIYWATASIATGLLICSRFHKPLLFGAVFCCVLILGMWRMDVSRPDTSFVDAHLDTRVTLSGLIDTEPSIKNGVQRFTLTSEEGSILVSGRTSESLSYGDEVSVVGVLETPQNFMTDQGTEFDYKSYLYKDDIVSQIQNAKINIIEHEKGSRVIAHLIVFKNIFVTSFHRILPSSEADLLGGLILGDKSSIDPAFRNDLVATGTIHIIALSGYNVSIVAVTLRKMLARFGPRLGNVFGALGIVFFVAMTGFQSSAIRAGVMAVVSIYARSVGRTYDAMRALLFSGMLMLMWNPKYLIFDVSFQLSFLATLGIIYLVPLFDRVLIRVPRTMLWIIPLREALSVTLAAQVAVLPLILYKMGTLSLIAPLSNIAVLPAIPPTMAIGSIAGVLGVVSAGLAYPFSFGAHVLLEYISRAVRFFAHVPLASLQIHAPLFVCICMYAVLVWAVVYLQKKPHRGETFSRV